MKKPGNPDIYSNTRVVINSPGNPEFAVYVEGDTLQVMHVASMLSAGELGQADIYTPKGKFICSFKERRCL